MRRGQGRIEGFCAHFLKPVIVRDQGQILPGAQATVQAGPSHAGRLGEAGTQERRRRVLAVEQAKGLCMPRTFMHWAAADQDRGRRDPACAQSIAEPGLPVRCEVVARVTVDQGNATVPEVHKQPCGSFEGAAIVDVKKGIGFVAAGPAMDDEGHSKAVEQGRAGVADQRAREDHAIDTGTANRPPVDGLLALLPAGHRKGDVVAEVGGGLDATTQELDEEQIAEHVALARKDHAKRSGLTGRQSTRGGTGSIAMQIGRGLDAEPGFLRNFRKAVQRPADGRL